MLLYIAVKKLQSIIHYFAAVLQLKNYMKKIFTGAIIISALALTAVYIYIPSQLQINRSITIHCPKNAANKILSSHAKWLQWWPGQKTGDFSLNNIVYTPELPAAGSFTIIMRQNEDSIKSFLHLLTAQKDSISLVWSCNIDAGINPFERFQQYSTAVAYADNMQLILDSLEAYLLQTKNVYGIEINSARVKDTLLMSTKKIIGHRPETADIYLLVNKLKAAIAKGGSVATNYPMLSISNIDSALFQVQVAIPVNKPVKEENDITFKRMVPGNILITSDITGGDYTVHEKLKQLEAYTTDFQKIVPAIPFQSLVTDRMLEPDTGKWITRIYCPVY